MSNEDEQYRQISADMSDEISRLISSEEVMQSPFYEIIAGIVAITLSLEMSARNGELASRSLMFGQNDKFLEYTRAGAASRVETRRYLLKLMRTIKQLGEKGE